MLHNSGPYGPNDVPINMGMPVNMTQMSNQMNLGHNLSNLPKMPQQAPETAAPVYDVPDYRSFGHSPLNIGHPMSPYPNYHHPNFQTNYVHPNPNLPHNTTPSLENNILPMNLDARSVDGPLVNYHNSESKKFEMNLHYRENHSRKVPINIPQSHTKAFQKHLGMESNHDQFNTVKENPFYNHDSTKTPEKSLIDTNRRKSLENTVKLIEDILINNTGKDKLRNVNTESILNNALNKSSLDMRNTKLHGIDSKDLQSKDSNLSHKISTHDPNSNNNLLRARLEATDTKPEVHGLNMTSKNSANKSVNVTKQQNTNLEEDHTKTTKKPVINELPYESITNNEKELTKIQSEIQPLRRSLIINNQIDKEETGKECNGSDSEKEDLIADVDIKKEIVEEDIVQVKLELVECSGSDSSPFLKDMNAIPREVLDADAVIIEENNVAEAKEAAKKGSNPKTYFECTHCNLLFRHPKRFLVHTKWHTFGLTNETRHRLEKERELKKSMKREARIIERLNAKEVKDGAEGDVHPCKDCDKAFSLKSSLKNHRQKYHPTRVRECKICKASVTGWMALRAHMAAHAAGAAPGYSCPDCPKRFKYAHSLAKHRDTHLEKTLSCEQCSKKFGSQALLKMHMKCHERAARGATFRCTYCGKGFFESYNLQVHERTHRNERPFTCDICKTSFATNSSLKRHLKVSHSTSKPFACETCHRCFASSTTLARHTARAHGDSSAFPHKCALCPRQYSAHKELQKHIGKTHKEERDRGEIG